MLKFLFGKSKSGATTARVETQRETVARCLETLNAIVAELEKKPAITINPNSGAISLALPDQMPDEALALPAPQDDGETQKISQPADETPKETSEKAA